MESNIYKNKKKQGRIGLLLLLWVVVICLASCTDTKGDSDMEDASGVVMLAQITEIDEYIVVEVLESEYSFGTHWVITSPDTAFYGTDGKKISRSDLSGGQTVEITYNGQVMLSYPPKIVATKIRIK